MPGLMICSIERSDGKLIYWLGDGHAAQFGICFQGTEQNQHRDGVVESISMALHLADRMLAAASYDDVPPAEGWRP